MDKVREIRLVGWKRIAKQLSCSERTARRWEREEALPVHRQKHAARSTVYAHAAELEAWLDSRAETKPAPPSAVIWFLEPRFFYLLNQFLHINFVIFSNIQRT